MWKTNAITCETPTLAPARAGCRPAFVRKRTLIAMAPSVGGDTSVAKSPATWAMHRAVEREPLGHESRQRPGGADVGHEAEQQGGDHPAPVRRAQQADEVDLGQLRQQHVAGDAADDDHDERARAHPLELDLLGLGAGTDLGERGRAGCTRRPLLRRIALRVCGERATGCSAGSALPRPVRPSTVRPVATARSTSVSRARVVSSSAVSMRWATSPAAMLPRLPADQPHRAVLGPQQVLGRQRSVRHLVLVQGAHGAPGLQQVVVGDLVEVAEAGALDELVGQQDGVRPDLAGQQQPRRGHAGGLRGVGDQRRMVEGPAHVEGAGGAVVAQPHAGPDRVRQAGALEVAVEDGDQQAAAGAGGAHVAAAAGGGLPGLQDRDGVAAARERLGDLEPAGAGGRGAGDVAGHARRRPSRWPARCRRRPARCRR